MIYILIIYLIINTFQAGMFFEEKYRWAENNKQRFKIILTSQVLIVFWLLLILIVSVWAFLMKFIFKPLQFQFWFEWWFTKTYDNLTETQLRNINIAIKHRSSNSISDRVYRFCANKILKRNEN